MWGEPEYFSFSVEILRFSRIAFFKSNSKFYKNCKIELNLNLKNNLKSLDATFNLIRQIKYIDIISKYPPYIIENFSGSIEERISNQSVNIDILNFQGPL